MGGRSGQGVGRGTQNLKEARLTQQVDWGRGNQIVINYGETGEFTLNNGNKVIAVDPNKKTREYIDVPEDVRKSKNEAAAVEIIKKHLAEKGLKLPDQKIYFSS